jgi:hypothetical protein
MKEIKYTILYRFNFAILFYYGSGSATAKSYDFYGSATRLISYRLDEGGSYEGVG